MLCDAFYEHLTMSAGTIIDSGLSNIDSAARALEYCGAEVVITHDPEIVRDAGRLVLLGVGAFPVAMERLYAPDLSDAISYAIIRAEQPMLSICLGRQLWADIGHENETTLALDLIKGDDRGGCVLLQDVAPRSNFYFVHGYYFAAVDEAVQAAVASYGRVPTIVGQGQVFGAQFHPEESGTKSFQILKKFLKAWALLKASGSVAGGKRAAACTR